MRSCVIDRCLRYLQNEIHTSRKNHDIWFGREQIIEIGDLDPRIVTRDRAALRQLGLWWRRGVRDVARVL